MLLGVELIVFGDPQPAKRRHTEVTIISFITTEFSNFCYEHEFADLVDEVVQQFTTRMGVKVQISVKVTGKPFMIRGVACRLMTFSVEIQAESCLGFDADLQRAVRENCRTLKFKSAEFEAGD